MDKRLFALALVTLVLYAPTVGYGYVYEDVNDLETFRRPWPFSGDVVGDFLRKPTRRLTDVSFAISGTDPTPAHVGNVVVHLVNGLLVYALASQVIVPTAAVLATGLFWLHPVQVESVAYISSRADLVATMCLLLAVLSRSRVWLSLLMAVCCVLAKETFVMALLIPLVAGAWDRRHRVVWAVWVAVAVPFVGFCLWRLNGAWSLEMAGQTLAQLTRLLWLIPFPVGLSIDHDWTLMTGATVLLSLCVWLVALSVATWFSCPRWSVALALIALFFLPRFVILLPEGLHEHHLYAVMPIAAIYFGSFVKGREMCAYA